MVTRIGNWVRSFMISLSVVVVSSVALLWLMSLSPSHSIAVLGCIGLLAWVCPMLVALAPSPILRRLVVLPRIAMIIAFVGTVEGVGASDPESVPFGLVASGAFCFVGAIWAALVSRDIRTRRLSEPKPASSVNSHELLIS
jgi:hypothetical protein